ncbi:MAG: hypothetical protein M1834_004879 [Cirrosporium novae-zelandiae]|nr:MAG: hypothetical protein M1834_004879 [Cirrosporium novae-zelandiae]
MVRSLVLAYFRDRELQNSQEDLQVDLGLIILLHGASGVGKTFTVEYVADLCRKPLYPITCGDLGITAEEVGTRLKRIFVQDQKWKCVLLLDEADVVLSERGNDFKRNSLVSEYYQGILFLTTNRVGRIDDALKSRIHISLYYPPLGYESTMKIFQMNLERTGKRKNMRNGRQIRNVFHIAIALAENEAQMAKEGTRKRGSTRLMRKSAVLRARHFELVENASSNFDAYLQNVLKMGYSDRAEQMFWRADRWKGERDGRSQGRGERDQDNYSTGRRSDTKNSRPKRRPIRVSSDSDLDSYDEAPPSNRNHGKEVKIDSDRAKDQAHDKEGGRKDKAKAYNNREEKKDRNKGRDLNQGKEKDIDRKEPRRNRKIIIDSDQESD